MKVLSVLKSYFLTWCSISRHCSWSLCSCSEARAMTLGRQSSALSSLSSELTTALQDVVIASNISHLVKKNSIL